MIPFRGMGLGEMGNGMYEVLFCCLDGSYVVVT